MEKAERRTALEATCTRTTRVRTLRRWRQRLAERRAALAGVRRAYQLLRNSTFTRCFQGLKVYWRYKVDKAEAIAKAEEYRVRQSCPSLPFTPHSQPFP